MIQTNEIIFKDVQGTSCSDKVAHYIIKFYYDQLYHIIFLNYVIFCII